MPTVFVDGNQQQYHQHKPLKCISKHIYVACYTYQLEDLPIKAMTDRV